MITLQNLWDSHMHTAFSGDSDTDPMLQINRAKELGLRGITITDHLDLDFYDNPGQFDLDLPAYHSYFDNIKKEYGEDAPFTVRKGLELGLQTHLTERHHTLLSESDFDYVIGSIHQIDKEDPYYSYFYEGKSIVDIYRRNYELTLENLKLFKDIDTLGHLDYIRRYAIREKGSELGDYSYSDHEEFLDAILQFIIKNDIALEVNSGAFRAGLDEPNPKYCVIKRYKELGGKLITMGADAHVPEHVALNFVPVAEALVGLGFDSYFTYISRKPVEFPFQ